MKFDHHQDRPLSPAPIVVAITGASGVAVGIKIVELLTSRKTTDVHVILSQAGQRTIIAEMGKAALLALKATAVTFHDFRDIGATLASGSFVSYGMIVAPCSMRSLAAIANSLADNLITRAADVHLKERRPLILITRETPIHLGHLRNMVRVTEIGAIVMPLSPAFYHRPQTVDDIVRELALRAISLLPLSLGLHRHVWQGDHRH